MDHILITGGACFIGQYLLNRLSRHNCEITVIDNLSNANKNLQITNISFHKVDIRNIDSISDIVQCEKIDTCIHLAAKINVSDSITNPFETLDINIKGSLNVLEACFKNGIDNFVLLHLLRCMVNQKKSQYLKIICWIQYRLMEQAR